MYIKKNSIYNNRKWLGKYSAYLAHTKSMIAWAYEEGIIEKFLHCFPKKRSLDTFVSCDVADFRLLHPKVDVRPIERFWKWLGHEKGLPLRQIVFEMTIVRARKAKSTLSLDDGIRVLGECYSDKLKSKIIDAMTGKPCYLSPQSKLYAELRTAAAMAGIPQFELGQLRVRTSNRIAKDMLDKYGQLLRSHHIGSSIREASGIADNNIA